VDGVHVYGGGHEVCVCMREGGVGRVRHVFLLFSKKKIQVCLEATFFACSV